jgi:hypothetical protein
MAGKVKVDSREVDPEAIDRLDRTLNSVNVANRKVWVVGEHGDCLWLLIRFMHQVVYSKKLAFEIKVVRGQKKATSVSKLSRYFELIHGFVELYSENQVYAPHLQLFFDCYRKHCIRDVIGGHPDWITTGEEIEAELFDDFIARMREEGEWIDVKKKVADWERKPTENLKRLHEYVNALFERKRARLLVVRIDFLYKLAFLGEKEAYETIGKLQERASIDQIAYLTGKEKTDEREALARIDIREVMKDRERLFQNMRGKPSLFEHLVGYVWSIEYSRAGGYHMHCAFLFDGAEKQKHEWLADQIGQYWETVITKGRGYYHNCNRGTYDEYVLGQIEYHHHFRRERLLHHLGYLAKKSQYVYVKPSRKCKLFGTGQMPQARTGGPGRPRKK